MNNDLSKFQKVGIALGVVMFLSMVFLVKHNIQRVLVEREAQELTLKRQAEVEEKRQEAERKKQEALAKLKPDVEITPSPSPSPETLVVVADTPSPTPTPELIEDGDPVESTPGPTGLTQAEAYKEITSKYETMSRQYRDKSVNYFIPFDAAYVFTENGRTDSYETSHHWVVEQWARPDRSIQVETRIEGDIAISGYTVTVPFHQTLSTDIYHNGNVVKKRVYLAGKDTWEWKDRIKEWMLLRTDVTSRN